METVPTKKESLVENFETQSLIRELKMVAATVDNDHPHHAVFKNG